MVRLKTNKQAGVGAYLLIEVLLGMLVMTILLAASATNAVALRRAQNQVYALGQVRWVVQAKQNLALCAATTGCTASPALVSAVPAAGTIAQSGYLFQYIQIDSVNWSYKATPIAAGFSGAVGYWSDQSGVIRCAPNAATGTSLPCQ